MDSCSDNSDRSRWQWSSSHRLYNLESQKCLGLDLSKSQNALKLVRCDSDFMLWWRCSGGRVFGASKFGLVVKNGTVAAILQSSDEWKVNGTMENICEVPYHVVYTTGGNSYGKPCEFPFLFVGIWYNDCILDIIDNREWCSTSGNFDTDGKWGNCLKPVSNCNHTWTQSPVLQQCYQFNVQSSLRWKEAYLSCKSQGADLLSITSEEEMTFITDKEGTPDFVWIGLNRLEISSGWQWSDNSPLNFINWEEGITAFSVLDGSSCGRLNVNTKTWDTLPCDASLPYICKKSVNHSADVSSEDENIWSGFRSDSLPHLFKWSDQTETHFTYWDQNEPLPPFNVTPSCVSFSGMTGRWHVRNCTENLKSICKKPGKIQNKTLSDSGCPQDKNWRRHGQYCYLIDENEVTFNEKCNLTIGNKFEQEFLNSFMREQPNIEGKYFWTNLEDIDKSGDYYWKTSDGRKALSYSNWNLHEPAFSGGCVAMAGGESVGESVGKWEVKDCKNFKARSICKQAIGSAKEEDDIKPSSITCPDGWFIGSEMFCYKIFHKERLLRQRTWDEAEGICEEFGGHLISFSHLGEMRDFHIFLKSRLSSKEKRWIWVGLNKRNLGSWEWSDGRPVKLFFPKISSNVLDEFQEDDYFLRDCAALEDYSLHPFHCEAQLEWVCQIAKGVVPKTPQWFQPEWKRRMGPAVVIDGSEYWFVSTPRLGHKAAELYCAVNGSELAVIDSYSTMLSIQDYMKKQGEDLRPAKIQKWWVKSANVRSHHQLILHRILGRSYSDCSFVSALSYFPEYFQRVDCNEPLPFVCKNQNLSLLETEASQGNTSIGSCPTNWTTFGDKCFLKVPPRYLKFSSANEYCMKFGGLLPSILSQGDQDFITYFSSGLNQKFWIGLRLALNNQQNTWVDGSGVSFSNFNPILQARFKRFEFDPFDKDKNQQCVFLLNNPKSPFVGTWDFTACTDTQFVTLCQKNRDNNGTTEPILLPEDVTYREKVYKILQTNMTWYIALEECRKRNMELVSINDLYQLSFLTVTVRQANYPFWIGLTSRDDGIHYRWQDGSAITLNRWTEEAQEDEDCVFIDVDGTWKTKSCDDELPGAFCHIPTNLPAKPPRNDAITCPHKVQDVVWVPYRNNCYSFLVSHKRWLLNDQRYICQTLHPDAYALNIRDEEENWFIINELQSYVDLAKWVWLGIRYDGYDNSLRWHDETFVKYSNWRLGRPNITNNSFFAGLKLDGFWDVFPNPRDFELMFFQQYSILACKIEMGSKENYIEPLPTTIPFSNFTYYVLKKKLTWFQAAKECGLSGGNLASVHDNQQQLFMENVVRQDGFPLWIGLWNNDGIEWSDGTPTSYSFGDLNALLPRGKCVFFDTKGSWRSKSCTERVDGALCYKPIAEKSKSTWADSGCPRTDGSAQWVRQKNFCYAFDMKLYNYSVYTSDQASKICQTLDPTAKLLTINDGEENVFVSKYLMDDAFITHRVWLGVDSKAFDRRIWLDGSPIKYNNWYGLQRKNMGPCAVLLPETGAWNRVPCTPGMARIVCKAPLRSSWVGVAVGFAIFILLAFVIGLAVYVYKRRHPLFFSSIRYRRAEDQMESMIDY
uniref:Lymphocyte antigen 75 n=1 Tax=Pyxicephalus adspersus TaxID=30357 RepID=A0AAV2ZZP7_PYXAD|nr:TPA: hypothetical protein GDO54_015546 [Pyxicephalus adspersus]